MILEQIERRFGSEWRHDSFIFLLKVIQQNPRLLEFIQHRYSENPNRSEVSVFGIKFPNKVGLAAGLDKNAEAARALSAFGFGHLEIGTVTPLPQEGNPKPRVWRLLREKSVINWLGFPNKGMEAVTKSLARIDENKIIIGVNLGKGKDTPLEQASSDYMRLMYHLAPFAAYFVINTSSPNTPELRRLNEKAYLSQLLYEINRTRNKLAERGLDRPTLLKLSPDHTENELLTILEVALSFRIDGLIATNTSISRVKVDKKFGDLTGGLSGRLLSTRSLEVLKFLVKETNGKMPIISVGGIMEPEDAKIRLEEGAVLVQVLTGFIYDLGIAKKINASLASQNG